MELNEWFVDKQLVAGLNLMSKMVSVNDLTEYPLVRDVLIPHKKLAEEVIKTLGVDIQLLEHANELIKKLETLDGVYNGHIPRH